MGRPQSRYTRVNPTNPEGAGQCDRCGRWFNLRSLQWQYEWSGTHLYNKRILVCTEGGCLDVPQEQLRTIILPPDPPPLVNARVPDFYYEEQTVRIVQFADPTLAQPPWGDGPQLTRCLQFAGQNSNSPITREIQYLTSI